MTTLSKKQVNRFLFQFVYLTFIRPFKKIDKETMVKFLAMNLFAVIALEVFFIIARIVTMMGALYIISIIFNMNYNINIINIFYAYILGLLLELWYKAQVIYSGAFVEERKNYNKIMKEDE